MRRRRSLESYLKEIKPKQFETIAAVRVTMPGNRRIQFECMAVRGKPQPIDWLCFCGAPLVLRKGHKCRCGARVSEIVRIVDVQRFHEARQHTAEMYWRETHP